MALEKTYNAKKFLGAFGEANLTGFGPDSFFTLAYNADFTSVQLGADGVTNTRTQSNDRSGTMTFTCMQHAPVNDILSIILQADENSGAGVRPFFARDLTTGSTFAAADCWIQKPPDAEFAAESGVYIWVFASDKIISVYGDPLTRLA